MKKNSKQIFFFPVHKNNDNCEQTRLSFWVIFYIFVSQVVYVLKQILVLFACTYDHTHIKNILKYFLSQTKISGVCMSQSRCQVNGYKNITFIRLITGDLNIERQEVTLLFFASRTAIIVI